MLVKRPDEVGRAHCSGRRSVLGRASPGNSSTPRDSTASASRAAKLLRTGSSRDVVVTPALDLPQDAAHGVLLFVAEYERPGYG